MSLVTSLIFLLDPAPGPIRKDVIFSYFKKSSNVYHGASSN